jgi:hypothetical protein
VKLSRAAARAPPPAPSSLPGTSRRDQRRRPALFNQGQFIFWSARSLGGFLKNKKGQEGAKILETFLPLLALLARFCPKTAPAISPSTSMN